MYCPSVQKFQFRCLDCPVPGTSFLLYLPSVLREYLLLLSSSYLTARVFPFYKLHISSLPDLNIWKSEKRLGADLQVWPSWSSATWVDQELMTSVGEGRSYVLPKKCGLWRAMTECSCDVGGVKRMGRNWCGTAAELVIGFPSSQTQHWAGQRQAQTVLWGPSIGGPLLLGGLSCQDALSPSSCWSVLPWMAVFPAAVLSSGGGDFVWVILLGKETSGFFPPWCEQLRGKVSIAILFSRSQLGAGRLENADLNLQLRV